MSPELLLRSPFLIIYVGFMSLVIMPIGLRGAINITAGSPTPVRTGVTFIGLILVSWLFFVVVLAAGFTPARLSSTGLRMKVGNPFRYDLDVRWDEIDRISLDPRHPIGPVLMIRLTDPEAVAAHRRLLRWQMRRHRARYPWDVALALSGVQPGRDAIAEALPRLSGGLHRLETLTFDGVPAARSGHPARTAATGAVIIGGLLPGLTVGIYGLVEGHWYLAALGALVSVAGVLILRRLRGGDRTLDRAS